MRSSDFILHEIGAVRGFEAKMCRDLADWLVCGRWIGVGMGGRPLDGSYGILQESPRPWWWQ